MIVFLVFSFFLTICHGQESPKINPFASLIKPVTGGKTSFACQALSGSLPLTIEWFKDDQLIKDLPSTRIRTAEDYSSLVIDSISSSHTGNYTCKVSNAYGADSYSIELKVEGSPSWNEKPRSMKLQFGNNATVKCSAFGYPKPKTLWKALRDANWIGLEAIDSISSVDRENLIIFNANSKSIGRYGCSVSNGIEPNLWAEFDVEVDGKTDTLLITINLNCAIIDHSDYVCLKFIPVTDITYSIIACEIHLNIRSLFS